MNGISSPVRSSQNHVHPTLEAVVRRHMLKPWQKPVQAYAVQLFEALSSLVAEQSSRAGIIIDAGCGTGCSTRRMADEHPDHTVIGIDRSEHRLRKATRKSLPACEGNMIWVRMDLSAFWMLAARAGWKVRKQLLFYPNPWPKPSQLKRRWHAHPVFPWILRLGGELELRCNWKIYADEFAFAIALATGTVPQVRQLIPEGITRFESKYRDSRHALYRVCIPGEGIAQFRKSIPGQKELHFARA